MASDRCLPRPDRPLSELLPGALLRDRACSGAPAGDAGRHSLVDFGTGFMRLALRTKSPIVPFAFLGGGDAIPTVTNLYKVGNLLGLPYLPVTPWLLPLPRPVGLSVHFGEPMRFEGSGAEDDDTMHRRADEVKARIADLIERVRR